MVVRRVKPMVDSLSQRAGVAIELRYVPDYAEILRLFQDGAIDLAYLGPLPFTILSERTDAAVPLARFREADGSERYTCALVSFADLRLEAIDPASRRVALTQPLSTCGFLATGLMLRRYGIELQTTPHDYTGSHSDVALSVVRGSHTLGGLKTDIARRHAHLGLVVEAESAPFPGFVLAGNADTLPADLLGRLTAALTTLKPLENEEDAKATAGWGAEFRAGAAPASAEDFVTTRQLIRAFPELRGELR